MPHIPAACHASEPAAPALAGSAPAAFDHHLVTSIPRLERWASSRLPRSLRGVADPIDLVHDAVAGLLRRRREFELRHPWSIEAYLRQSIENAIRDAYRREGRRPAYRQQWAQPAPAEASPLDRAIREQARARCVRALLMLAAADRRALVARFGHDESYAVVARRAGKRTADAARMTVHRARLHLARAFAGQS